jgi:hypothetical protein
MAKATKKITPASIITMLRKAKTTYQKTKPDPKSTAEVRHTQLVNDLKKLRDLARKGASGDEGGEKPFNAKRKELVKRLKEHWRKLKTEKNDDPNKGQVDKYRMVLGLLTLKVKALEYRTVQETGDEEDETADPNELEMVDLADMEKDEPEGEEPKSEVPPPPVGGPPVIKPTTGPKVAPAKGNFVALQQARLAWDTARNKAAADVKTLQGVILQTFKGDPDLPAAMAAAKNLQDRFNNVDERLLDKLDEALSAKDETTRAALQAEAKGLVDEYAAFVNGDEVLKDVDANPFVPVAIFKTLSGTLNVLKGKL